ncbi:MAG TPA: 4Fe-4S ferredoxin, partial [Desulfomonilia bacterium]|nr:4Fe-4S ferredoxin [Desulfomonilia bacterium]
MPENIYEQLRQFLDRFPLGMPKTESGLEIRILGHLFTEDEAEAAMLLTPFAEEASQTASRMNLDAEALENRLEALADKGLIFRIRRGDKTLFNAVPFMIGLYEYSVQQMDAGLAELYRDYYEQAYQAEMAFSDV